MVLTTASWIGGRSDFLGVAYLAVGSASLLISFCILILQLLFGRAQGDLSRLSWNKPPPPQKTPEDADCALQYR